METLPLQFCTYNKNGKTLSVCSEFFGGIFPSEISIVSHYTGESIIFIQDTKTAEKNEFWDGECMEYIPKMHVEKVKKLIVHHAF